MLACASSILAIEAFTGSSFHSEKADRTVHFTGEGPSCNTTQLPSSKLQGSKTHSEQTNVAIMT